MKYLFTLRYWTKEAFGCLIAGGLLCALIFHILQDMENDRIGLEFQQQVDNIAASLYREVSLNFEASQSLSLLFYDGNAPSEHSFVQQATAILARHPSINSLQWLPRVSHQERLKLEAENPSFIIKHLNDKGQLGQANPQDEYFPVTYIAPADTLAYLVGMDPSNEPLRRNTLRFADATGTPHASGPLQLLQNDPDSVGMLSYIPVYSTHVSDRKNTASLRGYVTSAYHIPTLFKSALLGQPLPDLSLKVIDTTSNTSSPLYQIMVNNSALADNATSYVKVLPVFWGRKWAIEATPTQSYLNAKHSYLPLTVLGGGLMITLLASMFINSVISRANTVNELVRRKSKALNEANRKLEVMCETDALTGLANRRALDKSLQSEWKRAARQGTTLSCLMIDIDHFKAYNDNYGHPQGDVCLRRVAKTLQEQAIRASDMVARYGGEEFVILLPSTNNAEWIARKCLQAIRKLHIPHEYTDVSDKVTVSIGMSDLRPRHNGSPQALIEAADDALYRAKDLGRNRLQIYSDKGSEKTANTGRH